MSKLESQILKLAKESIGKAIDESLNRYNGPLPELCKQVLDEHNGVLYQLINDEVTDLLSGNGFREVLKLELRSKLAKILIARMGGELEKQVNQLKANPATRARITLAIESCIDEI